MILAGIDIGTNTLRLLIADIGAGFFREIYSDRRTTRLGKDLDRTGVLSSEAEERTLEALLDFKEQIRNNSVQRIAAIGTSALRRASNAQSFIADVRSRTGFEVSVASGDDEAQLTLLGVRSSFAAKRTGKRQRRTLLIDIGGGSTEIIVDVPGRRPQTASLLLGAVYLSERFVRSDPPLPQEVDLLRSAIRHELVSIENHIKPDRSSLFIGTAGTITTLAAVAQGLDRYDPARITGYVLTRDFVDDLVSRLLVMTAADRRSIRGLEQGREDIILAGTIITQEIMNHYGHLSMLVSDWGLREGILLSLYEEAVREGALQP